MTPVEAAEIHARYDGDEVHCGACDRVIAVGVVPARADARIPCKACGRWVLLGLPRPPQRSASRYPMAGV